MHEKIASRRLGVTLSAALLAGIALAGCSTDGREMRPPRPDQFPTTTDSDIDTTGVDVLPGEVSDGADTEFEGPASGLVLTGGWPPGGVIATRHTCEGDDVSPSLRWFGVPAGTSVLALVVTNPEADGFVHWVIANVNPLLTVLVEGEVPPEAYVGVNDAGVAGWTGPCPPDGLPNTYVFELRALDQQIELPAGAAAAELLPLIDLATIAATTYEGRFP